MKTEMLMPQMGESITEATVLKWLKRIGDQVQKDEPILEISTDKVDSEIPSPASGRIVEILAQEGDTVAVQSVIAVIDAEAGVTDKEQQPVSPPTVEEPRRKTIPVDAPAPAEHRVYSPLVLRLAEQHDLKKDELAGIPGSGQGGRVTKSDVLEYLERRSPTATAPSKEKGPAANIPSASTQPASPPDLPPPMPRPEYGPDGLFVEPMDNMRKRIAEHMVRSKATSPHVYSMAEVDVSSISKWRKQHQQTFLAQQGFKLSFTPFFLEAVVRALNHYPRMNASVEGDSVIYKQQINLGCAVALGEGGLGGLIVPVIKNATQLNFVDLARALHELSTKAREKKLSPQDVQEGTFTLTNPGIFGNIMGCPIINQPQVGILGTGAIKKRPVVIGDAIAIREIMILTLSYDHRVIDGALSGHFLRYLTRYLEGWDMNRTL